MILNENPTAHAWRVHVRYYVPAEWIKTDILKSMFSKSSDRN